jgi:hypothetical protein
MNTPVPSLFRYYMCMSLARDEFNKHLHADIEETHSDDIAHAGMAFLFTKSGLFMQIWYGMLFVVVEGWEQSGLRDPEIEQLLTDADHVTKLRNFRNAVFHYQKQFLPVKQEGLFADQATVDWVTNLSDAFKRKLLEAMKAESPKP